MKIVSVVGARPQFVKLSFLAKKLNEIKDVEHLILNTGQHYDNNMAKVFFEDMNIPEAKYSLAINEMSHGAMTGRMIEKIEQILLREKPSVVIVYGDTNSTLAGALATAKLKIPLAHVEAGMRSFNMRMPEEINRIIADRLSNILFCSTKTAVGNLINEGFKNYDCSIHMTGDIMLDVAMYYSKISAKKSNIMDTIEKDRFILCTIHRAENTDNLNNLKSIFNALNLICKEIPIVLPLHPRTRKVVEGKGIKTNVRILEPVGYLDMLELLKQCTLVMTDSGGLQKEAYFFKKPCLTLRNETEWVELIDSGCNIITGTSYEGIYGAYKKIILKKLNFSKALYGKGKACDEIIGTIRNKIE